MIACLLPVRNGAEDLPGYLRSAERFCDAVIALDDGSTDATAEILDASPLVERVLRNPVRDGWHGWNDAANRQRLLDAAGELAPDWIAFVDADELLDPADGDALRTFLETEALPGCAYGLRHHRMWGPDRCDARFDYVYRVFAHRPGLELPTEQLHFNPVPTSIPRGAWVRTTLRLQHFAAASEERVTRRLAKYAEADPDARYGAAFGHLADLPDAEHLVPWAARPTGLPVLEAATVPATAAAPPPDRAEPRANELVCLLPVRNGASDLPGWLESVRRFADAVVALDDGSTDETAELLEAAPLVRTVLRNPRRDGYAGWDDSANRQQLLDAAGSLEPGWLMQLDVDERIDPEDAVALRRFVEQEAVPGDAYGFRVHRMTGPGSYDRADLWAHRLFAHEEGQRMPAERLHFVPVPTSIPPERWRKTTFRIQHFGGTGEARRAERFGKYREADPDRSFQSDYGNLLERPRRELSWQPRPERFPALADPLGTGTVVDLADLDPDAPLLSAVVISRNDEDRIERTVRSVVEQECPQPFEVIVVVSGTDRTAEIVRERFPDVTLIELEGVALPGRARNAGVAAARGEYVSFPGSHVELPAGSIAARLAAHELGHSMVTGSLLNGTDTPAGWASYFLDHAGSLPGRPSGPLNGPPAHCSYRRELLVEAGGFPEDMRAGEDTVVNNLLFERGYRAYRASEVALVHRSRCERPTQLLRHHFGRGRAMGRILRADLRTGRLPRRRLVRHWLLRYLPRRLRLTATYLAGYGDPVLRERYSRVRWLVRAGATAAWAGIWAELLLRRDAGRGD